MDKITTTDRVIAGVICSTFLVFMITMSPPGSTFFILFFSATLAAVIFSK